MARNKELQKQRQREWYRNNKDKLITAQRKKRRKLRAWFDEILSKLACIHCGQNHPATLDFHHRDSSEKDGTVSSMLKNRFSKRLALKEIEKCDVLCANCHRIHHYEARLAQLEEASDLNPEQ